MRTNSSTLSSIAYDGINVKLSYKRIVMDTTRRMNLEILEQKSLFHSSVFGFEAPDDPDDETTDDLN